MELLYDQLAARRRTDLLAIGVSGARAQLHHGIECLDGKLSTFDESELCAKYIS